MFLYAGVIIRSGMPNSDESEPIARIALAVTGTPSSANCRSIRSRNDSRSCAGIIMTIGLLRHGTLLHDNGLPTPGMLPRDGDSPQSDGRLDHQLRRPRDSGTQRWIVSLRGDEREVKAGKLN